MFCILILFLNSPNCEFNNGIISVDNKLFIRPPYKVDNIDGDVKNYSHIINIVFYIIYLNRLKILGKVNIYSFFYFICKIKINT